MVLLYLMACIPIGLGALLWVMSRKVVWWEWLAGAALALATAGIGHVLIIRGMTADEETWSGTVVRVVHHPQWVEEYQQAHTRTVGSGKNQRTETYYTTEHRTHPERWVAHADFGTREEELSADRAFYAEMKGRWGGAPCERTVPGDRPGFDSGDRNDYVLTPITPYIVPAVVPMRFENRVKAAPSVFSYAQVPPDANVYAYPAIRDWRESRRLLGSAAAAIPIRDWDLLNARLGPRKKVNLILAGFGAEDSGIAQLQEAKWIGGKKNDLVLCYGGSPATPSWSYVFGWTESELVKRNLETILLRGPIDPTLLPKIEAEVTANYELKDWSKFDYISLEPPWWSYLVVLLVMAATQAGFLVWAYRNATVAPGTSD